MRLNPLTGVANNTDYLVTVASIKNMGWKRQQVNSQMLEQEKLANVKIRVNCDV